MESNLTDAEKAALEAQKDSSNNRSRSASVEFPRGSSSNNRQNDQNQRNNPEPPSPTFNQMKDENANGGMRNANNINFHNQREEMKVSDDNTNTINDAFRMQMQANMHQKDNASSDSSASRIHIAESS